MQTQSPQSSSAVNLNGHFVNGRVSKTCTYPAMSKQPQEIEVSSFITFNHLQFISLLSACIFPFLIHLKTSRRIKKLFTFCYWLLLWVNLMTGSLLALPAVMCVCVCVLLAVDTALIIRHAAQRLCTVHWALQLKPASVHCKANNAASVHQSRNQALIRWLLSVHMSVGVCVRVYVCLCVFVWMSYKSQSRKINARD